MESHWSTYGSQICLALSDIVENGPIGSVPCPKLWQKDIVEHFERIEKDEDALLMYECFGYIKALRCLSVAQSTTNSIMHHLASLIRSASEAPRQLNTRTVFTMGSCFKAWAEYVGSPERHSEAASYSLAYLVANDFKALPLFLEGLLTTLKADECVRKGFLEELIEILTGNLHSPSHGLRKLSLEIIRLCYAKIDGGRALIMDTALIIENAKLDMKTARATSTYIRKLASQYNEITDDHKLRKAVSHFCFGILTYRLSQLWGDAIDVLKAICESRDGEEIVSELALEWLKQAPERKADGNGAESKEQHRKWQSEFECTNLNQTEDGFRSRNVVTGDIHEQLRMKFNLDQYSPAENAADSPSIALRVLLKIPRIAEKRSRFLLPFFFQWAAGNAIDEDPGSDSQLLINEDEKQEKHQSLSLQNRKSMLQLFALFSNPKVLYRSSDIFDVLRGLLANGDPEVQKLALKVILTWKMPALQSYEENLLNILDDARFREEISTFFYGDDEISIIQDEHRADLMPVLLRLLYGRMISRTGSHGAMKAQNVKRKAVLEALSRFPDADLRVFLNVVLGPVSGLNLIDANGYLEGSVPKDFITPRKQVGLLNMLKDMLTAMGARIAPFYPEITLAVIYCLIWINREASRQLSEDDGSKGSQSSLVKTIRQIGLHCLDLEFQYFPAMDLRAYLPIIFAEVINGRLESLAIDSAQSVSRTLQLVATWASSKEMLPFLVEHNPLLLRSISRCLEVPSAKDAVRLFVLDRILKPLVDSAHPQDATETGSTTAAHSTFLEEKVLLPNVDTFLCHVGGVLRKDPSKEVLASSIEFVSKIAPMVQDSSQIRSLLEISAFLLEQPSPRVNPRIKGDLLRILQHFLPRLDFDPQTDLQNQIFRTISSLFSYFKDRQNRVMLSQVLIVLAERDSELQNVARLCASLNSFEERKIDTPDFEQRLRAFSEINEHCFKVFSGKEWRPILYNMLFYIKDTEEIAIRSNASFALQRVVEANVFDVSQQESSKEELVGQVLLPALRQGVMERSELVRTEYLAVMAHLIRHNPGWSEINDMSVLLVSDDEEASFFSNVLHIQQHRRLRALRRLALEARQYHLRSQNIAHFFLPLIEHFVFDAEDSDSAHNLSTETTSTIGVVALSLEWPQFRAIIRRYTSYIHSKPDLEKILIKLIGVLISSLNDAAEARISEHKPSNQGLDNVQLGGIGESKISTLTRTLPKPEKLADDILNNLLPGLSQYLHDKDESVVSLRIPVAVSVVKLLNLLPAEKVKHHLPAVLTDVCNILRSRAQESRDLTRKTLAEISAIIGPSYFGFVLKELRGALARGYQLHVLSYTVHTLLVATSSVFEAGDLNYCLPQIVGIIMDDIFGVTGLEKDAEEYISRMKEVKSSKSYDSMELIAKIATVENFVQLLRPLQNLLQEKLDFRTMKKIDELLRRIGVGLLRNEVSQSHQLLIFCHEVVREVYKAGEASEKTVSTTDHRTKRFLANVKSANGSNRTSTSSYGYKLVRFSFDLLRSVLHKYDVLQSPANLAGFMPMIGDAMVQLNEEVQMSAIRLLTTIIKVPLREIDNSAAIYIAEAVKIIKVSSTTKTELAQSALKLVSSILRERRDIEVQETDIAYLLKRSLPDLEELDRQGVAFNFLKAVIARKVVITEVYEVLDTVASLMVTSQTRGARDVARSVYLQFLIDYPQGKGRYSKQMAFLVKNLEYKHQEGRQSIMEVVHLLFQKVGESLLQDIIGTFFVPLVMVIANDETLQCRDMAGLLIRTAFERANPENSESYLALLRTWLDQIDQPLIVRVSLQVYDIYFEVYGSRGERALPLLQTRLAQIIREKLMAPDATDWELTYQALQSFFKACQIFPKHTFDSSTAPLWASIRQCLSFPHAWVKLSASRLLGLYFADFARANADAATSHIPLKGSGGLYLSGLEIEQITKASLRLFKAPSLREEIVSQTVRNLIFLGKMIDTISLDFESAETYEVVDLAEDEDRDYNAQTEGIYRQQKSGLGYIFQHASAILRREPVTTQEPSLIPIKAALQLVAALCNHISLDSLRPYMETILLPLHNFNDTSIPQPFSADDGFTNGYKALVSNSSELMALLQKRMGTTEYITYLSRVREGVKRRRDSRKIKRRIEAVAEPEKTGRIKKRKGEQKKVKRAEKSSNQRSKRRGW